MAWKHGASGYNNNGCRCEKCKEDWRIYRADYRMRRVIRAGGPWSRRAVRVWVPGGAGGPRGVRPSKMPQLISGIGGHWIPGVDN